MQSSTISSMMTQSDLTLVELHTTQRTESNKTNSSNSSRLSDPLKKASTKLDQELKKLKARVSKHKVALQEGEQGQTTTVTEAVDGKRDEGGLSIDRKANERDEAKASRREARRARWAARRASIKGFAKKTGKAVAITGAVVLGFIFGPVLIVIDLAVGLAVLVIRLLIGLVQLICVPSLICFAW